MSARSEAWARRQDRILLRVLGQLGPHLRAVSMTVPEPHRPGDRNAPDLPRRSAIPHLRAARRAIDSALAALARKP